MNRLQRFILKKLLKHWHMIMLVLFIAYSLFIVYYTLLSRRPAETHTADLRFMWAYQEMFTGHPEWKEDVWYNIANILFFVPFGFLFPKKKWKITLLAGIFFSICIEAIQYIACLGLCELDDVICNGFGALIGFWFYMLFRAIVRKYFLIEK